MFYPILTIINQFFVGPLVHVFHSRVIFCWLCSACYKSSIGPTAHDDLSQKYFCLTDQNTTAFKEVAIIRHPRVGEYAFGFITSTVVLQVLNFHEDLAIVAMSYWESPFCMGHICFIWCNYSCFMVSYFCVVLQTDKGDEELCSVYVPTNHLYIGDIFLLNSEEIIRPNLSIREGIGNDVYPISLYCLLSVIVSCWLELWAGNETSLKSLDP